VPFVASQSSGLPKISGPARRLRHVRLPRGCCVNSAIDEHEIVIVFDQIVIKDPTVPVVFNYEITNMRNGDNAKNAENALKLGTYALYQHYQNQSPSSTVTGVSINWFNVIKLGVQSLVGFALTVCDGPVAVDQIIMSGKAVEELAKQHHTETRRYEEKSQDGCGRISIYYVTWTISEAIPLGAGLIDYVPSVITLPPPK
jgi:hypothetical protein